MKQDETIKARARKAGIELTPQGEPIFARDMQDFQHIRLEVQKMDTRTDAQRDEDALHPVRDYPL